MVSKSEIGSNLKFLRLARSWTQARLASALSVQRTDFVRWEQGIYRIPADKISELSVLLKVNPALFLTQRPKKNGQR